MPRGIFNPYVEKKPKKNFQSPTDPKNPFDTEFRDAPPVGDIKLDGDSYVLELRNLDSDHIAQRLGELISDAVTTHREVLVRHGIDIIPKGVTREIEHGEVSLPTPHGAICVFVSTYDENKEDQTKIEIEVFRRIACAFREIPREILERHKARVIVRA